MSSNNQKPFTKIQFKRLFFICTLPFLLSGPLVAEDWGDAPDPTYPTLAVNDGARHTADEGLFLGSSFDEEADGQPTATADGDDVIGGSSDEDGIVFATPLTQGSNATINITATGAGLVDAWIDYNNDGDWDDAGEQILVSQAVADGLNAIITAIPAGATPGTSFARFRISSAGGLAVTGLAADGEVEDYQVTITAALPAAVQQIPAVSTIGLTFVALLLGGVGIGAIRKIG
jgi:hypothetical protein